ncbi:hypothetical protein BCR33DRAFT_717362 [Rhizoclosmatium globosum]|uniref:Homeobox domain-containing protein n=1 Tax=Rhizoclosmatium globosum TaxID=329046 RepID=A0A1Y2C9I8_9FUNG|nr:hypothetical protein BCR33DRAFT_717362 [Rhizoclosmatium globosum]|eukprot:ORY43701.1 hypothetical protein BCR33DRAFT_717362 [Rhizoclosmatium globosum]
MERFPPRENPLVRLALQLPEHLQELNNFDEFTMRPYLKKGRRGYIHIYISDCEPECTPALIGRWWAARLRLHQNGDIAPTSTRKTPEQLEILEHVFSDKQTEGFGIYPSREAVEWMVQQTDLTYKQIKSWFEYKRRSTLVPMMGDLCIGERGYYEFE